MIYASALLLASIFFFLSGIHFYWALGGDWGFSSALPTKENGECFPAPKKVHTAIVGFGLLAIGFFYVIKMDIALFPLPEWVQLYVGWAIVGIFLLRTIGDFKYVGLFKSIKNTTFGQLDTKYFIPLCAIIAILGFMIELL